MNEQWAPIAGYPGYEVSTHGRFRRLTLSGYRILKGKIDRYGYRQIGMVVDGKQKWALAHRIVAKAFLPHDALAADAGQFMTVNHKDRCKTNNDLANLELISVADNASHWRRHPLV